MTFSVASSPIISPCSSSNYACLYFSLKIFAPRQTLFSPLKIVIFCRIVPLLSPHARSVTMRRPPQFGSPHRGILCVEKIGSAAPELQEWPGAPSKPVKSTNGPFYWLTRKRAPPCRWTLLLDPPAGPCRGTLSGDPCKNWLPARIGGWPGTATGGQIHVVHISHTHPPKELIQALRKYLLGKINIDRNLQIFALVKIGLI